MQTASIQQMDTCNVNNLTKQVSFLNLNENQVNTVEENTESPLTSPRYFLPCSFRLLRQPAYGLAPSIQTK